MSGNSFGTMFRVTTFGESHGPAVGVVIDGCPPRLPITVEEIQVELDRRRPGQSAITTQRRESDTVEILSGVRDGVTLGTPISLLVRNSDQRSGDYDEMRTKFRPSHADYTYQAKFGVRAWEGGGRASARETIGRVAAGVLARKALAAAGAIDIVAWVQRVQDLEVEVDTTKVTREAVESNIVRCPDGPTATKMIALIDNARKAGDSLGGVVEAVARGVPPGLGEPVFDKLDADLAKAMLSLPAAKGFEIGSGFAGTLSHRQPAQRSVLQRRRQGADAEQPLGRRPGRHLERRGDRRPGGVQADGHHPARAGDRRRERPRHHDQGPGQARPLRAAARGPDRRSDARAGPLPITSCGSAASADSARADAPRAGGRHRMPRAGGRALRALRRVDAGGAARRPRSRTRFTSRTRGRTRSPSIGAATERRCATGPRIFLRGR